ncbi:MAG: LysR family transcriptional regulator [Archangiaceae bacterium]|nr:LysR family transcriptional regulator [Archangiaceae bacterium]
MDIAWEDLKLFLAVAETGSFSSAAKRLKLGQPTVSRRLADLEYALGYKLFNRTASGAAPTAAAARLLEPARKMAEWAGEVQRAAAASDREPQGTVRVAAPPGVAFDFVAPFAAHLRKKLPKVQLELLSKVEYLDLARGEADLALRFRPAPPSGDLVNVATLQLPVAICVSKGYAARLPPKPSVAHLDWVAWAPPFDDVPPNPQLRAMVPDFKPVFTSDNFLVLIRACEAGVGAMPLSPISHRFSLPNALVPLDLPLGPHASTPLNLVCARSALDVPRVKAVADLLVDELQRLVAGSAMKRRH